MTNIRVNDCRSRSYKRYRFIFCCNSILPIPPSLPDRSTTSIHERSDWIGWSISIIIKTKQIVSITRIPSVGTMHRRIVLNTNSNSSIGAGPDRRRKSLSEEVALMLNPRGILTDRFSLVPSNTCSIRMVHWLTISLCPYQSGRLLIRSVAYTFHGALDATL